VSVSTEQEFKIGQPQALFESPDVTIGNSGGFDVAADGQRFVVAMPFEFSEEEEMAFRTIRIVQNWCEEFRDREQ
jgi:hypothetical protein